MSGLPKGVRAITDELDAVGNTMKAVTKGYAIASAGLAAVVLFGSYYVDLKYHLESPASKLRLDPDQIEQALSFSLKDPKIIIGLSWGTCRTFFGIQHERCRSRRRRGRRSAASTEAASGNPQAQTRRNTALAWTVTKAALKEMIVPALLPVAAVVAVAAILMA
jgi:K(+)-stimulated pyrophosphate-energized sodium pump